MEGLPSFFQKSGTSVLDEFMNLELEKEQNVDDLLDQLIEEDQGLNEETFGEEETFGDLNANSLPDFFATPSKAPAFDFQKFVPSSNDNGLSPFNPAPGLGSQAKATPPPPGLMRKPEDHLSTPSHSRIIPSIDSSTPSSFLSSKQEPATFLSPPPPLMPISLTASLSEPPKMPELASVKVTKEVTAESVPNPALFTPKPNYGKGDKMTVSDVRFVVSKIIQPLETLDPYADDFYFIQYNTKKNLKAKEEALKANKEPPSMVKVPLPTWKETKERIKLQIQDTRRSFLDKTKEWEEKEQVLGHRVRSEISKPREILNLPNLSELDFDLDDDDGGEFQAPFSSRLWSTRVAVQRGYEALYTVQELQYLLSCPDIASNPLAVEEIRRETDEAIQNLSTSLGVRTSSGFTGTSHEYSLDGRHVAAIIQTVIGKKLLCRGLKLLLPQQRWTLIPVVIARVLISPYNASSNQQESVDIEKKLLRTIIDYLQFSQHQFLDIKSKYPNNPDTITYTKSLLDNLRSCLKNILIIQTSSEKKLLRESILSDRTRAELTTQIVTIGDKISEHVDERTKEEWKQTKGAFLSFFDN